MSAPDVRTMVTRGHRTSSGYRLAIEWRNVDALEPGDVLASLRAGDWRTSSPATLEHALNHGTYANVEHVDGDDVATLVTVTTRMGSRLSRDWRNSARLPVLILEPGNTNHKEI